MKHQKIFLPLACFIIASIFISLRPQKLQSVRPINVKDTLSTSQLSYFARLGTGNTINDTILKIALTANPSNTTNNLFVGDTIAIGTSGATTLNTYTVNGLGNTATFQIGTTVSHLASFVGNAVIATRSAIHTISFTPQSNKTAGAWQFLIKATSRSGETYNDGIPDQQGFDFGATTPSSGSAGLGTRLTAADVSCPFGTASVGTTAVINSNSYHVILCDLAAGVTNPVGVGATVTIGRALASGSQLINPAPALSHTEGQANSTADTYSFFIRHLDDTDAIITDDTIEGKIAVVESVRVTATVDPSITFYVDAVGTSASNVVCGNTLGSNAANTTATAVAFGSLNLAAFNNLAQRLSCVTNADNGYVVTVYETDQMKDFGTGNTIPDTNCDAGTCTYSVGNTWVTDVTQSSWGYTLQNISANTVGVGSTSLYKAFGKSYSQAQSIMSNASTPAATEQAYICYRLVASSTQPAGNYENQLTYTATATF
ncbi:MAG: hypothetical protein WCV93_01310 [Candidatus Shapirobacteria bacterium]